MVEEDNDNMSLEKALASQDAFWLRHYWRAPTVMCTALLSGVIFAIGHHFFYTAYNHEEVARTIGQEWINFLGTAFAFLVQTCLVVAAGSAYVQRQWHVLRMRPFRINQVDAMFSILEDATLFTAGFWHQQIILALLAIITWWVVGS